MRVSQTSAHYAGRVGQGDSDRAARHLSLLALHLEHVQRYSEVVMTRVQHARACTVAWGFMATGCLGADCQRLCPSCCSLRRGGVCLQAC